MAQYQLNYSGSEINQLLAKISVLESNLNTLQTTVNNIDTSSIQSELNTVKQQVQSINDELDTKDTTISNIQAKLTELENTINSLNSSIDSKDAQVLADSKAYTDEQILKGGSVDLSGYAKKTDLPTHTSQLTNDSDFATNASVDEKIANVSTGGQVDLSSYAKKTDLPTKTSQLTNDSNFADKSYVAAEISKVSVGGGAVFREPTLREVFTCTVPDNFSDASSIGVYSGNTTTGANIQLRTRVMKCPNTPEVITISTSSNMRSNKSELTFTRTNYYEMQSFTVTPLSTGEGTVTITAPNGYTNTAKFTITGEDVSDAPTLSSISAVYTQGGTTVYPDTSLDTLKTSLVVTANYSDGFNQTITNYVLSGNLTVGTSTITVSYENKTTTFNVVVTAKEQQPETPAPSGDYVTDGLTHMVDFTQYPIGYTGEILDTITNQALVTSNLDSYTIGRAGFVEEGMFSAGRNKPNIDVSAYIPESSIGQITYPITIEGYVRLRNSYNAYKADGVRELETERKDTNIFSTRDTSDAEGTVNGIWVKYMQNINTFSVIETLNNTNISAPEGTATPLFAYNTEDLVWTHILVVFGANDKRLYINGELVVSGNGGTGTPSKACCIKFSQFDWKVFRMYNKALTAEEVQNNYNVTISTMGGNQ